MEDEQKSSYSDCRYRQKFFHDFVGGIVWMTANGTFKVSTMTLSLIKQVFSRGRGMIGGDKESDKT